MPAEPLRIAVIGVGHLGRHHARILSGLDGAKLVAVVDTAPDRAAASAAATGARAVSDFREVLDEVDAVTVAVPTELHRDVAIPFLERGIAVLVEKPMARSLAEADELVAAAHASGAVLAVGHTERYNPAVAAVLPLVTSPRFIEVHRMGVFPDRSLDIDVVFDLMIHDLDVDSRARAFRRRIHRSGRGARPDPEVRHRERPAALRDRVHRERDREPHQPRARPEDPVLSARCVPVGRLRRAGSRGLAARAPRRRASRDRGWAAAGRAR